MAGPGRPRKSAAIHEISGAKRKDPQRFRDREPEPETKGPIGDPPPDFLRKEGEGPKLLALWNKLVAEAPMGILTASDSEALEAGCRQGVESKRTGSKGQRQALKDYLLFLRSIGMTPDGRAIRGIGGKAKAATKEANRLDEFAREADGLRQAA